MLLFYIGTHTFLPSYGIDFFFLFSKLPTFLILSLFLLYVKPSRRLFVSSPLRLFFFYFYPTFFIMSIRICYSLLLFLLLSAFYFSSISILYSIFRALLFCFTFRHQFHHNLPIVFHFSSTKSCTSGGEILWLEFILAFHI